MSYLHDDSVSTSVIVRAAAERIGKIGSAPEIQRICDYLINKNWFQTAADLRVARENTQEWHMLEVPGRLKIAIQEELDALATVSDVVENEESQCEASTALDTTTELMQEGAVGGYGEEVREVSQAVCDQGTYSAEEEAANAAAWAAYYAANGYDMSITDTATETQVDYTEAPQSWTNVVEVGEAVEGYTDETIVAAPEVIENTADLTSNTPSSYSAECTTTVPALVEWSCGQCTYMNAMSEAFCEICQGHISLSPDYAQIASSTCTQEEEQLSIVETELAYPPPAPETIPLATALEIPLYTSIPSPLTSLYSPSAPDFEEDDPPDGITIALSTPAWCTSVIHTKMEQLSLPSHTLESSLQRVASSGQGIDFCALAFHKKPFITRTTST